MEYFERPRKNGSAQKAWDKYCEEHHQEPKYIYYSPSYQYQYKGWICEWFMPGDIMAHIGYGAAMKHTFYMSADL